MFPSSATTSGTYLFDPSSGELIINAFGRIQVRRTEILASHLNDGIMELNLLLARISNQQPNLWTVDLQSFSLVQGTATYTIPTNTIMVLDCYISYSSPTVNRILNPISRTEFASIPNPTQQGFPTQFWFDRTITPSLSFYLTPDGNGPYTLNYYRVRQIQDAQLAGGLNVEVPYRWLDALVAGLAHRLSRIYAPQLEGIRKADADEAWAIAATQDTENVGLYIVPGISGYFRP